VRLIHIVCRQYLQVILLEDAILNRHAARLALLAIVATVSIPAIAYADHDTALVKVASELGYSYGYLGPEDAVSLSRPGVTIVIRPGERLFDVNDRTEAMDGPAPHFYHSDVYVSDELFNRLRQIAARYPAVPGGERAIVVVNPNAAGAATISGAISGLHVGQTPGDQSLTVSGAAPANLPVTLTLIGTFSSELPDVVLSRREITADADGTFRTTIPVAGGYFRGGLITVDATSVSGITPAKQQLVLRPVNDKAIVPADQTPRSER
jgi:hypothetical protein